MTATGSVKAARGEQTSSKLEASFTNSKSPRKRRRSRHLLQRTPVLLVAAVILTWEVLFHARFPDFVSQPQRAIVEFSRSYMKSRREPYLAFVGNESTLFEFSHSCVDALRGRADVFRPSYFSLFSLFVRDSTRPTCRARLCHALRRWAKLARERELRSRCSGSGRDSGTSCGAKSLVSRTLLRTPKAHSTAPDGEQGAKSGDELDSLEADPLPEEEVEKQQAAGVGQICTEAWRRGVLRRVRSSKYIRRLLAEGETSVASISAGIDAVCGRTKHVEAMLLNHSSVATPACGDWPEECWPVPHMPFASLADFPRRKYLVFAMSEEQLSNARTHIVEAALLARMSNRILVLPKASRSHVSLGRELPVCEYWDLSRLAAASEWVSPQFFLLLARATLANPSVAFMWVESPYLQRHAFHFDLVTEFLGQLMPFTGGHVPLEANTLPVTMPTTNQKVAALLNTSGDKDIVVWFKTTWERVEFSSNADDAAFPLLPYSRHHHATAARLLALLPRPLIAVHFRSEFIAFRVQDDMQAQGQQANASMVQERLEWCVGEAEKLITRVRDLLSHPSAAAHPASALAALAAEAAAPASSPSTGNLRSFLGDSSSSSGSGSRASSKVSVFIAADVPFNTSAAPARSDSWQSMVKWYKGDQAVLLSSLAALRRLRRNVQGTVMVDELMPHVNTLDPGVVAILDKLVSAHADVFLAGSWNCGGGRGYESDIIRHRRQFNHSDSTLMRWAEG